MFYTFAKATAFAATALTLATASFADTGTTAQTNAQFESYELAQTVGMDRRQDRRTDRRDDRQDRRFDRQDCRQDNGLVGNDKRNCKQGERQQRNANG
ncbi:hypothetical protein QEZ52_21925 (plasmid) [Aliisedimentitalea scapharcae]|uniref:Uncharacterized protein n=1 Tax=Aliisedimentitalea scapharcae TaxID=1524259 RepID=A0ABZ2Y3C9_9RHOB|nr:hypothetical protein K3727_21850 [Rhodobacteraceae bacterium M382]